MKVIAQSGSHRIVDDAPISLAMEGVGLYSIEEQLNGDWWVQVYPEGGKCTTDFNEVTKVFHELISK